MKLSLVTFQSRNLLSVVSATTITTLVVAGVSFVLPTASVSQWSPQSASPVVPVVSQPWSASSVAGVLPDYVVSSGASVSGVDAAVVLRPQGDDLTTAGAGVVSGAMSGVKPLAGPVAANEKGAGDFSALPGVGSGSWGEAGQTGGFTWSYPFSVRSAPAGPSPSFSLSYDSSRVDGLTSSTNNQASVVGDGWALGGAGSIRQSFAPCMDQGVSGSYDLCGAPGGQQFNISFGGRSGPVIKDAATGVYKLQNDDNTKVEYLTSAGSNGTFDGGYWKLTDTAGAQYFFGLNRLPGWVAGKPTTNSADTVTVGAASASQPCWAGGNFTNSLCQQANAWNLDYVVDLHGNSEAFYYDQDTNSYSSVAGNGPRKDYVRSSRVNRVEYGMRAGRELVDQAPLRLLFDYTGRCDGVVCGKGNDVPTTFNCTQSGACSTYSPTFFSDKRLVKVRTDVLASGAYAGADVWNLKHSMPDPGDGTKPALWLGSVDHQGVDGKAANGATVSDPAVVFGGQTLQNRVWVVDGLAPLDRYRLSSIKTVTGAVVSATYKQAECSVGNTPASPQSNTMRCFPQWWAPTTPIAQPARMDYFHIYPVESVSTTGGPGSDENTTMMTRYEYLGAPAWKYAGPKYVAGAGGSQLSWSVFAGYGQVKTTTGNETSGNNPSSIATYLRGLDGTPADASGGVKSVAVTVSNGTGITDSPWLAGLTVENQSYLGTSSTLLSSSISIPWASAPTATGTQGTNAVQARHIAVGTTISQTASGQGNGWRVAKVSNFFDAYGRVSGISATGESGVAGDESCAATSFADNTGLNVLGLTAVASTYAGECNGSGAPTGNLLKSSRTFYDGAASAVPGSAGYVAPTLGNTTRSDQARAVSGQTATEWQQGDTKSFDVLGRVVSATDSTNGTVRTSSVAYSPASGLPTQVVATNPSGWTQTTVMDPVRGQKLSETDPNGNVATTQFDASGRMVASWDPLRPKASNPDPSVAMSYSISQIAPSWVKTVKQNSTKVTSYTIYDGQGRVRQTQSMSPGSGTIVTDMLYNSLGSKRLLRNKYYLSTEPDGTLRIPALAVPSSTEIYYDGAGRQSKVSAIAWDNQVLWSTQLAYAGLDTQTITGPGNESARTVVKDANGSVVKQTLFHGPNPTGVSESTSYSFDLFKQMTGMADAAGNGWSWSFDPLGRQVSAKDPDTGTSTSSFDNSGRAATSTNAAGVVTSFEYDSLDRATAVKVAASAGAVAKTLISKTFDGEKKGQLSMITRFNGTNFDQPVKTSYSSYNGAYQARATTVSYPSVLGSFAGDYTINRTFTPTGKLSGQKTGSFGDFPEEILYYGYDDFDNPSSVQDADQNVIAGDTQYDHLGNMSIFEQFDTQLYNDGANTTGLVQNLFNWDATTGRLESQWSTNLTRGVKSDLGKTSYTYNEAGRIISRETGFAGRTGAPNDYQCYAYDSSARLSPVWTPGSKKCDTTPSTASTSVPGLGGIAPYAQTLSYTLAGDRSQLKRFDAAGNLASTDDYTYPVAGSAGPHQLQSVKTTTGVTSTTANFGWDAAGRMTNRSGQTLGYTLDGRLDTTTGASAKPVNPNPNSVGGTAPAATGVGNTKRFYDGDGNLIATVDGTGTTATFGAATAFISSTGVKSATGSYSFAGKTVAQRTQANGVKKLSFIIGDSVNTGQTILQPTVGNGAVTSVTRFTDPFGLARGATQAATGNGAFTTAPAGAIGQSTNAANPNGLSSTNGYISGLADTGTSLTHLGARDLDPTLGIFTTPDPVMHTDQPAGFTPYGYSANDPINKSDPSGLDGEDAIVLGGLVLAGAILAGAAWLIGQAAQGVGQMVRATGDAIGAFGAWVGSLFRPFAERPAVALPSWFLGCYNPFRVSADAGADVSFGGGGGTSSSAASSYRPWRPGVSGRPAGVIGAAAGGASAAADAAARIAAMVAQNAAAHAASVAATAQILLKNDAKNAAMGAAVAGMHGGVGGGYFPNPEDDEDELTFGRDDSQNHHSFRHTQDDAGLKDRDVIKAVVKDSGKWMSQLEVGIIKNIRTFVGAQEIEYSLFRLHSALVRISRIVIPK